MSFLAIGSNEFQVKNTNEVTKILNVLGFEVLDDGEYIQCYTQDEFCTGINDEVEVLYVDGKVATAYVTSIQTRSEALGEAGYAEDSNVTYTKSIYDYLQGELLDNEYIVFTSVQVDEYARVLPIRTEMLYINQETYQWMECDGAALEAMKTIKGTK